MKLHHIGVEVEDIDKSRQFYEQQLGYQVHAEMIIAEEKICFLYKDQHFIELVEPSTTTDKGTFHIAYEVDHVERVADQLTEFGARIIEGPIHARDTIKLMFMSGINGEVIELMEVKEKC
ncbi:VOC family protein [Salirhabdus salicampi]|uniref:VOC family protein n=1 Tax=Salirhabdus salicampi TaxID=476102 RepID=UPI0020C3E9BD|nr:VOC family protein [Salirhabdus salicampi]MCP8617361.1 VOC family protein [Salirhabdus salicampi]